ncbi:hypothetical protein [Deferrisoma palaeochoriense]
MTTRRGFIWLLCLLALPLLTAMGGGGAGPVSDTIPRPKENHRAELVDRQGVVTRVELLACNGKTFLPLERGEGTLMVPFAKIRKVTLGEENGSRLAARVEVEGADALEGRLARTLLFTGVTDYGNYRIEARGLAEIRMVR